MGQNWRTLRAAAVCERFRRFSQVLSPRINNNFFPHSCNKSSAVLPLFQRKSFRTWSGQNLPKSHFYDIRTMNESGNGANLRAIFPPPPPYSITLAPTDVYCAMGQGSRRPTCENQFGTCFAQGARRPRRRVSLQNFWKTPAGLPS